jgi:hypothetical protein
MGFTTWQGAAERQLLVPLPDMKLTPLVPALPPSLPRPAPCSYKPVGHGRPGIGASTSSRFIPLK